MRRKLSPEELRERKNARWRAAYWANPEKAIERVKKYRKENRSRIKESEDRWRELNPEKVRLNNLRGGLKRYYGMSLEEYRDLLASQDGKCAICGIDSHRERFHVDHDHETGAIRGALCRECNLGLGHFKDNPDFLRQAAEYLIRHAKPEDEASRAA